MSRNLILYFSHKGENYVNGSICRLEKGNTEIAAEFIEKAVGGDLFEVETVKGYSDNYRACVQEARNEMLEGARPELKAYVDNLDAYDNIFVCGPCWCGTFPCAVFSQLERLDFTGKKVMGLMTNEGSGLGKSEQDLEKYCKGATFGESLAVHGAETANSEALIADWAKANVE